LNPRIGSLDLKEFCELRPVRQIYKCISYDMHVYIYVCTYIYVYIYGSLNLKEFCELIPVIDFIHILKHILEDIDIEIF
jgi:hypothetical protein